MINKAAHEKNPVIIWHVVDCKNSWFKMPRCGPDVVADESLDAVKRAVVCVAVEIIDVNVDSIVFSFLFEKF